MIFSSQGFFQKTNKPFDFTTMIPQLDLFLFVFWKKLNPQKTVSKLTDLYSFPTEVILCCPILQKQICTIILSLLICPPIIRPIIRQHISLKNDDGLNYKFFQNWLMFPLSSDIIKVFIKYQVQPYLFIIVRDILSNSD